MSDPDGDHSLMGVGGEGKGGTRKRALRSSRSRSMDNWTCIVEGFFTWVKRQFFSWESKVKQHSCIVLYHLEPNSKENFLENCIEFPYRADGVDGPQEMERN